MKRLKITKNGKVISRKPGQNHFNAKEGRSSQMNKKRGSNFHMGNKDKSLFLV